MRNRYFIFGLFILVAAAQLYVPTSMILEREGILKDGKTYRFKTQPVDPNDPMRGKYVKLAFRDNEVLIPNDSSFEGGEEIYVLLNVDENGFAQISDLVRNKPAREVECVKAIIGYVDFYDDTARIQIDYPFDRLYMEETKAPEAEEIYNEAVVDSTSTTFAVVRIKEGEAVLQDVMIDGISIKELIMNEKSE